MSVTPIDLQTNMAQMLEVGKNEQSRTGAIAEQQHLLDKESDEKSKQVKSKLDESKKGEKTVIMDQEGKQEKGKGRHKYAGQDKKDGSKETMRSIDETMGKFIDVLK